MAKTPNARRKSGPVRKRARSVNWPRIAIVAAVAVVVLLGAFVVTARATDASKFCGTCHEMQPYYDAWSVGKHHGHAQCIDCHVDNGFFPRLIHKAYVVPELWGHAVGDTSFPRATLADVPNSRCLRCHPRVVVSKLKGFSHALHEKQGECRTCHYNTGHDITQAALESAGIFNPAIWALRQAMPGGVNASPGAGKANLAGHIPVVCSNCHDMAATPCSVCHTPPHGQRGECSTCHRPGADFVFHHPPSGEHPYWSRPCKACHPTTYSDYYCTCHHGRLPLTGGD